MPCGITVLIYRRRDSVPFSGWLARLKDRQAVGIIRARLNRIRLGNFGDCKPLGAGVEELRIHFGPGYRIYFGRRGSTLVILLAGGDKSSQAADIATAQKYWKEFLDAQDDPRD